ncbi:MAG: TetR/AcrR family transcriptional regulator [Trueperaceae bacterium]
MSDLPQPATARGEATRRKLLDAAELEFGERGFHAASISSITGRAGVAQGTFYLYFPSKEEILRELVRYMGRELRRSLSEATSSCHDRMEVERKGLQAFVEFSLAHENLYRVVMQSQFVDEGVYREYYRTLADGYSQGLARAHDAGEIRSGDAEAQAWALMGIAHFLGLRYAIWEKREPPPEAMETLFDLIAVGLAPRDENT